MIYAEFITRKQKDWLERYEKETGFEPLHQDELDSFDMSFAEVASANIQWFQMWFNDAMSNITEDIPE